MAEVQRLGRNTHEKIITLTLVAAALAVSACNTISGVGRDVSAAGSAVAAGAEEAKNQLFGPGVCWMPASTVGRCFGRTGPGRSLR